MRHWSTPAFALAFVVVMPAGRLIAQQAPNRDAAVELRKQFMTDLDTLQSKFLALAEAIPADKYAWRPAPGVRSVGEVFMHVASEYYVFTPMSFGAPRSPVIMRGQGRVQELREHRRGRTDVQKHLVEGFAYTKDASHGNSTRLTGGNPQAVRTATTPSSKRRSAWAADLHEHLGQLIAYSRMLGVNPPWSK